MIFKSNMSCVKYQSTTNIIKRTLHRIRTNMSVSRFWDWRILLLAGMNLSALSLHSKEAFTSPNSLPKSIKGIQLWFMRFEMPCISESNCLKSLWHLTDQISSGASYATISILLSKMQIKLTCSNIVIFWKLLKFTGDRQKVVKWQKTMLIKES